MRDYGSNDIETAAHIAQSEEMPQEREQPSREDVADLGPRPAFTPHPRERKIGAWSYVPPACPDCHGTSERVLNPSWPHGNLPYSEKCPTCGGTGNAP